MKNKKGMFLLWAAFVGAVTYIGYKGLTSLGADMAYDKIVEDLDTDQTVIMDKPNGGHIFVRKVDIDKENKES